MIKGNLLRLTVFAAALAGLTACAAPPYVYVAREFDRDSNQFRQGVEDRSKVEICYAKRATQPAEVCRLAAEECGRFGKRAEFIRQTLETCPLRTPVAAVFACLAPGETLSTVQR